MVSITILGAGFAGLAAAQRGRQLQCAVDVYEKHKYVGGHASSMVTNGFTFDEGPHVSFTKIPEVKALLAEGVSGGFYEFASIVQNYFKGSWLKHPVQAHLFGLPPDLITKCILGFIEANANFQDTKPEKYSEWLCANLGKQFSEEFPYRYTRKYWAVEPSEMTTDWIGPRMYKPNIEEMIRGALGEIRENKHYITDFRYPKLGGFGSYSAALESDANFHLGFEVDQIDPRKRTVQFTNGQIIEFESVVSSLPLPELISRIIDVPNEIQEAVDKLVCTSVALVDVGVARDQGFPPGHWQYFYDEDICFARSSYPHLLAPANAPAGCGSIQVEVYYTKQKPLAYADVLNKAVDDMIKCKMLSASDNVLVSQVRHVKYANVLFNHDRQLYLPKIEKYLDSVGIHRCGRYGLWNYHWTDESIVSGWQVVDRIVQGVN
jgi:protoporphyrinogen oxidase